MIIELGVVALAAAVGGVLAARAMRNKPPVAAPALEPKKEEAPAPDDRFANFAAGVGDVIQVGDATRWPRSAIVLKNDDELLCAVLLSEEAGARQATVVMAPPDQHLYWLVEQDIALPPSPPARLEVDGCLLDRAKLLSVALEPVGDDAFEVAASGRFALYLGAIGDAAVILEAGTSHLWYGQRLAPEDYDRLGQVGPRQDT